MIATPADLLKRVRDRSPTLSPSERRVAELALGRPDELIYAPLAVVARQAGVSEPTVVRFCRSVGCTGFQDFKLQLAQSMASHFPYADLPIDADAGVVDYATKVFDATLDTLVRLRRDLDVAAVEAAVEYLTAARKIEFYGLGASGSVAQDAQHKFFRLPVPCVSYSDPHMQTMSAAALGQGDVVVAISHTGRTRELLESAEVARRSSTTIIAITSAGSPLAALADVTIAVNVPEDTDLYTPMTSRMAHLAVVDVLALGVALRGGRGTADRLRRMKESLASKRVPKKNRSRS